MSTARLRSKRIDSLLEKRIVAISKKQAQAVNKPNYLVTRGIWQDGQAAAWDVLQDIWPTLQNWHQMDETNMYAREIAKCGGYLDNDLSAQLVAAGVDRRSMFIRLKNIACQFHFVNEGLKAVMVDVQLSRYAYDKMNLFLEAVPQNALNPSPVYQDHKPFCTVNTLTPELYKYYKQSDSTQGNFNRKFTVLARKRIYVPPGRMIEDPQGVGLVNTLDFRHVRLFKSWPALGKKERYQIINGQGGAAAGSIRGSLADGRYFFSIRVTGPVKFLGVTAVKFCGSHALDRQLVFDLGAPQAQ